MISFIAQISARLRAFFRTRELDKDFEQEFESHFTMLKEENLGRGMTPEEADRAARVRLGSLTQIRESHREVRGLPFLEIVFQDFRYAARVLLQNPGFAAVAIATLALGIGSTAGIFSVVDAALLRPLPFAKPDRLVSIQSIKTTAGPGTLTSVSPADVRDWREQSTTLEHIAAYSGNGMTLREDDQVETIFTARVTEHFFEALGVRPLLGRFFSPDEYSIKGPRAVVISHHLWMRRFRGDPTIIGRRLKTGEVVIGVMPAELKFPNNAEAWQPIYRDTPEMDRRSARYFLAIGRLRNGQSLDAARAEMKSVSNRLAATYPTDDKDWTVNLITLTDWLVGGYRSALLMIFGAVGLVLLIACANVSGLMLARSTARRKEVTVRLALGATRSRLILQFLFEGLLLSAVAAIFGLGLARWIVEGIFHLLTKTSFTTLVSLQDEVHLNGPVIIFTVGVSLVTGVLFTLIPAAGSVRITIADALREARVTTRGEHTLHKTLVLLEVACAVVLVAGASLLMQGFARMEHVEYGYVPHGLGIMPLPFAGPNRMVVIDQALTSIKATPGVESAALMSFISFGGLSLPFNIEGQPLPGGDTPARYSSVSADYFRVLKARLITGREFNADDSSNAPPVAIINETLARQYFQGENPIGRRLVVANLNRRVVCDIVGVVADIRQDEPLQPIQPEIFVHWQQVPWIGAVLVFRTPIDPSSTAKAIQTSIASLDKTLPRPDMRTLDSILADQVAEPRLYLVLLGAFAIAALLLALIGIYGLVSYIVNRRLHDMAIRIAIGARRGDVLRLVVGEAMRLSMAGIAFGLVGASILTRMLEHWLFGVNSTDPATFAIVALLLLGVALSACIIPARRATKADPVSALRHE